MSYDVDVVLKVDEIGSEMGWDGSVRMKSESSGCFLKVLRT